jgi:hypothetical protein
MAVMIADNSSRVAPTGPTRPLRIRSALPVAPLSGTSSGIFPDSEDLSLTVCPVHALSMGSKEWVEMAWAARHAAQKDMNLERRGWFESVKCLLLERDLPPSKISSGLYFDGMAK